MLARTRHAALALSLALAPSQVWAQGTPAQQQPAAEAIRVFLDCNTFCDGEFIRREITYVNWVRDRADADVQLIITSQSTGGGGREYRLRYLGLRSFRGTDDELTFATRQSDTDDEIRRQQTQRIGLGLARYVARGPNADQIRLSYTAPAGSAPQQPRDPWDFWVFRISANGFFSGESQQKFSNLNGSLSASRVTEALKLRLSANASRNHSSYTLSDSSVSKTTTSLYNVNGLLVRSLGQHWSLGLESALLRSTFENYAASVRVTPEVEFDVFPYHESSRRQFTFVYALGFIHNKYRDTTLFDKLEESRPYQSLSAGVQAVQPWGNIFVRASASNYLDDFSKNRLSINGSCEIRIVRGLDFNFFGRYSRVRDQLSLVKGGLTDEDIFLRLKQLKTAYRYSFGAGLSYRFGSKFNNVVNPRFGGGGGNSCFCDGGSCFCN